MSAHTPGPWSVGDDAGNGVVPLADVPVPDVVVAMLPSTHHANARLIAAAPDLLAALKQVVSSAFPHPVNHPTMTAAWKVAQAAIAKAEGRS